MGLIEDLQNFKELRSCNSLADARGNSSSMLWWAALCAILISVVMLGCATPHATLIFIAPATAASGTPFSITVNVIYEGKPDAVINSHIHFTSSDPLAILPGDYYYTPADAGSHTFTNAFVLTTAGTQTISGYIFDANGIDGSATIAVSR